VAYCILTFSLKTLTDLSVTHTTYMYVYLYTHASNRQLFLPHTFSNITGLGFEFAALDLVVWHTNDIANVARLAKHGLQL